MKVKEFNTISKAMSKTSRQKPGKAREAARLVLTRGYSQKRALEATGADKGALSRILRKFVKYQICDKCGQPSRT